MSEYRTVGVENILRRLERGVSPLSILNEIESREKGFNSEEKARVALNKLDIVRKVNLVKRFSPEDKMGIDMNVVTRFTNLGKITVQVKSSESGVLNEFDKIQRIHRLADYIGTRNWLNQNKRVLVIGVRSESEIQEQFLKQLEEIHKFHLQKLIENQPPKKDKATNFKKAETKQNPETSKKQVKKLEEYAKVATLLSENYCPPIQYKFESNKLGKICEVSYLKRDGYTQKFTAVAATEKDALNNASKALHEFLVNNPEHLKFRDSRVIFSSVLYDYSDIKPIYKFEDKSTADRQWFSCKVHQKYLQKPDLETEAEGPTNKSARQIAALLMLEKAGIFLPKDVLVSEVSSLISELKPEDYRGRIISRLISGYPHQLPKLDDLKDALFKGSDDQMVKGWTKSALHRSRVFLRKDGFDISYHKREGVYWISRDNLINP